MSYATITHLTERYLERDLRHITDPDAQAVNVLRSETALQDASDEIDTHLGARYILPLQSITGEVSESNKILARISCDIAIYRLQVLRAADDIKDARQRYNDAIKVLEKIANGELVLAGYQQRADVTEGSDTSSAGMAVFGAPPSLFGRGNR